MIRLNDLTIGYGHRILLQHASATIPAGELVALVGRNGTGKSTLLRAIAGLGERLGGEIRLDGHSLETLSPQQLATTVSFVTTERVRIPNLRCEDVVALGRAPYTNWIGRVQEQDKDPLFGDESGENLSYESLPADHPVTNYRARQVASCLRNNSPLSTPIKRISHQPK